MSQIERLNDAGIDIKKLSRDGVTLFFTQVFDHAFFHADMHPGNILVATDGENFGKYVALDFGIMGTLNEVDKNYLAINFLAFFRRDYHRVAGLAIPYVLESRVEGAPASHTLTIAAVELNVALPDARFGRPAPTATEPSRRSAADGVPAATAGGAR